MYTLRIYTDNEFLRQKYSERLNHACDSGVDLYCPERLEIPNGTVSKKIDFQIHCQLVDTQNPAISYGYLLVPRSSIVKTPLRMANSIGIIDRDYTGSVMAFVDNIQHLLEDGYIENHTIEKGDRLFQIIGPTLHPIAISIHSVAELPTTKRGSGGFGSTGK